MTAKTHKHIKRRRGNAMMESLGFSETPTVTYTRARPPVTQSRPRARHVADPVVKPRTVQEIWDTTELRDDTVADWEPLAVERRLDKGVRWSVVLIWLLVAAIIGLGGYLIWQDRMQSSSTAVADVQDAAENLDSSLESLTLAATSFDAEAGPVTNEILSATAAADDAGRALFSAAANLPATRATTRSIASEAASQALAASRSLTNVSAYIGAVTPILTAPNLITDPELIDLATAATDFGEWQARFEMISSNLPDDVMTEVNEELAVLLGELDEVQASYLDALREDDRESALEVVRELEGRLLVIWDMVRAEADLAKTSILGEIQTARDSITSLTG